MIHMNRIPMSAGAIVLLASSALAQPSNVDATNKFAWCENVGWTNWRDANLTTQGVHVGSGFLSGFVWFENAGWMNTGNGTGPYANTDNTNFGVNIGASGFLNGFAWCENLGWANFNTQPTLGAQGARFNYTTLRFEGYVWLENAGWMNMNSAEVGKFVSAPPACCPGNATKLPGTINFSHVLAVLANFGSNYGAGGTGTGDANCSGNVDFGDVLSVLANFGTVCP